MGVKLLLLFTALSAIKNISDLAEYTVKFGICEDRCLNKERSTVPASLSGPAKSTLLLVGPLKAFRIWEQFIVCLSRTVFN